MIRPKLPARLSTVFLLMIPLLLLAAPRLQWKRVPKASGYMVEIRKGDRTIVRSKTTRTYFSLKGIRAGTYRARISSLNKFYKPSTASDWFSFKLQKGKQKKRTKEPEKKRTLKDSGVLQFAWNPGYNMAFPPWADVYPDEFQPLHFQAAFMFHRSSSQVLGAGLEFASLARSSRDGSIDIYTSDLMVRNLGAFGFLQVPLSSTFSAAFRAGGGLSFSKLSVLDTANSGTYHATSVYAQVGAGLRIQGSFAFLEAGFRFQTTFFGQKPMPTFKPLIRVGFML